MIREILEEKKYYENVLREVNSELQVLPKAKLRVSSSNGSPQYFINGEYVSKANLDFVKNVAKREYYEKISTILPETIRAINNFLLVSQVNSIDALYEKLCKSRQELLKKEKNYSTRQMIVDFETTDCIDEIISFEKIGEIYSMNGEQVRSKSEKIIADELYRRGIKYKYEMPLCLWDRGIEKKVYPDFTVLNTRRRKRIYVEHFGMMDDLEYSLKAMQKIDLFERNGLLLGRDLLIIHETKNNPINMNVVNMYIEEFLG